MDAFEDDPLVFVACRSSCLTNGGDYFTCVYDPALPEACFRLSSAQVPAGWVEVFECAAIPGEPCGAYCGPYDAPACCGLTPGQLLCGGLDEPTCLSRDECTAVLAWPRGASQEDPRGYAGCATDCQYGGVPIRAGCMYDAKAPGACYEGSTEHLPDGWVDDPRCQSAGCRG